MTALYVKNLTSNIISLEGNLGLNRKVIFPVIGQNYTTYYDYNLIGDNRLCTNLAILINSSSVTVTTDSLSGNVVSATTMLDYSAGNPEDGTYDPTTYWDDLRVPLLSTKLGGSKDPTLVKFKDNGSGSQGVFCYRFSASAEEELYFQCQIPHSYKYGTNLHPHIHWVPSANGSAGQVVNWGFEYTISEIGSVFGNTVITSGNSHVPVDSSLVASKHYLTSFPEINGSAIDSVSAMLSCRVFRDATGALGTDDYASPVFGLEFDFHYEKDTSGSRGEYSK